MDLPEDKRKDVPRKPAGGGAAARLRQFEQERGLTPSEPEREKEADQGEEVVAECESAETDRPKPFSKEDLDKGPA